MVKKIKNKNVKIVISILQSYPLLNLSQFWEHGIEGPYLSKKNCKDKYWKTKY